MWIFLLFLSILSHFFRSSPPATPRPAPVPPTTRTTTWIFLLFLSILAHFFRSPLPAAPGPESVPPPRPRAALAPQVRNGTPDEPEGSKDTRKAGLAWTRFLSLSGIMEVAQSTVEAFVTPEPEPEPKRELLSPPLLEPEPSLLPPSPTLPLEPSPSSEPSTLPISSVPPDPGHVTGIIQRFAAPSPSALWEMAKGCEKNVQEYVPRLLGNASAYLPSTLSTGVTGVHQVLAAPMQSASDFWEMAKGCEKNLQDYAPRLLGNAAAYFKSTRFTDVTSAMHHIVSATTSFRGDIKGALDARHISFETVAAELERAFAAVVKDLQNVPFLDRAPGHAERAEMVQRVLVNTTLTLTTFAANHGIEEKVVTTYVGTLTPHVQALIIAVGDINEQHPYLLSTLQFSVMSLVLPEMWILKPFLSTLGFGPLGPIKGSAAAWMQRRFWGAAVAPGSWFALLQAAGMGSYPCWAGLAMKAPLLIKGVLPMVLRRLNRGQAD